jgi:hypothetical protein
MQTWYERATRPGNGEVHFTIYDLNDLAPVGTALLVRVDQRVGDIYYERLARSGDTHLQCFAAHRAARPRRCRLKARAPCKGLEFGGVSAEKARVLARPAMGYVREQLRARLAREIRRRYLRWLHPPESPPVRRHVPVEEWLLVGYRRVGGLAGRVRNQLEC